MTKLRIHKKQLMALGFIMSILLAAGLIACGQGDANAKTNRVDVSQAANQHAEILSNASMSKATSDPAGDWPQWLGPNRDAIVGAGGLSLPWGDNGPKELWRTPIGSGFSAISVAGGVAYTMESDDGTEYLIAFDPASGKKIWRFKTGSEFPDRMGGDGPRATPVIENGLVYTYSAYGQAFAVNASDGKLKWAADLVDLVGAKVPRWGFSTSPLIEGDLVILEAGGGSGKSMVALNKNSGDIVWTAGTDRVGYSSPIAVTINGVRQIICFTGSKLVSLSPKDGSLYWEEEWRTSYDVNSATPMFIAPDKIFISSEYDVGAGLFQVSGNASGLSSKRLWKTRDMKNKMATSVLKDGHIFGFDGKTLRCIDVANAETKWRARGYGEGTLMIAGDYILALSDRGKLGLIEATTSAFNELGTVQALQGKCWTIPTLSNGILFLRNEREMVAYDLR